MNLDTLLIPQIGAKQKSCDNCYRNSTLKCDFEMDQFTFSVIQPCSSCQASGVECTRTSVATADPYYMLGFSRNILQGSTRQFLGRSLTAQDRKMQSSCTDCFLRKVTCDKQWPVCCQCTKRGVAGQCWYKDYKQLPDILTVKSMVEDCPVSEIRKRKAQALNEEDTEDLPEGISEAASGEGLDSKRSRTQNAGYSQHRNQKRPLDKITQEEHGQGLGRDAGLPCRSGKQQKVTVNSRRKRKDDQGELLGQGERSDQGELSGQGKRSDQGKGELSGTGELSWQGERSHSHPPRESKESRKRKCNRGEHPGEGNSSDQGNREPFGTAKLSEQRQGLDQGGFSRHLGQGEPSGQGNLSLDGERLAEQDEDDSAYTDAESSDDVDHLPHVVPEASNVGAEASFFSSQLSQETPASQEFDNDKPVQLSLDSLIGQTFWHPPPGQCSV